MANFWTQAYLSFKGLFPWLQWWSFLSSIWIRPFTTTLMFAVIGRFAAGSDTAERFIIGLAVAQMFYLTSTGMLRTFGDDLYQGTLSFVLSSPVNRFRLYWARGLPHSVNGYVALVLTLLSAWLILDLDMSDVNWPALILASVLICLSGTALVLSAASFVIASREHSNLNQAVVAVILLLTGIVIPVSALPVVLNELSYALPVTNGLIGFRAAFDGATVADIADQLLYEAIIGVLLAVSGFLIFRYVEAKGRERGFIEGN